MFVFLVMTICCWIEKYSLSLENSFQKKILVMLMKFYVQTFIGAILDTSAMLIYMKVLGQTSHCVTLQMFI